MAWYSWKRETLRYSGFHDDKSESFTREGANDKIDPASGKVIELSMVFQDLLFLQQVGVIPMNPAQS